MRACGGRRLRDGTRRRRDPWADVLRLIRTRPAQLVPPSAQCLFTRSKHVSIGAWVCPTDGVCVRARPAFWTRPDAAGLGVIPACLQAVRRCVRAGSRCAQPPSERAVRRETKARTARARPTIPSQTVRRPSHPRAHRWIAAGWRPLAAPLAAFSQDDAKHTTTQRRDGDDDKGAAVCNAAADRRSAPHAPAPAGGGFSAFLRSVRARSEQAQ